MHKILIYKKLKKSCIKKWAEDGLVVQNLEFSIADIITNGFLLLIPIFHFSAPKVFRQHIRTEIYTTKCKSHYLYNSSKVCDEIIFLLYLNFTKARSVLTKLKWREHTVIPRVLVYTDFNQGWIERFPSRGRKCKFIETKRSF